jgi:hypothetical protein
MERIAFVTYRDLPGLSPDDLLAAAALTARGADVVPLCWDEPEVRWGSFDAVVVRSCWDYYLREAEFRRWLDGLESAAAAVWNPAAVLRWNLDKRYLRELADAGAAVIPTLWFDEHDCPTLAETVDQQGWNRVVVKPAVSAGAHHTRIIAAADAQREEGWFRRILRTGAVLVQPYLAEIETNGEWSLIYLGGEFSHAVRKVPRAGDFRVQPQHGGLHTLADPGPAVRDASDAVLARAPGPLLYARVDGVEREGRFELMELEVLEPALFLEARPGAPADFADAILRSVRSSPPAATRWERGPQPVQGTR